MTDDELAVFLGIDRAKRRAEILAAVTPAQRQTYEEMQRVELALKAWKPGEPRPPELKNAIICGQRGR